ncbi:MAG TPA: M12 family metallo-peptidase [Actinomycetota bacterium]|nr:M12 family metallo-peptidase [Actinomycetota bacterium]
MEGLRRFATAGVVLLALLVPSSAGAAAFGPDGGRALRGTAVADTDHCNPTTPAAYATTPTGNGQTINLDVLVLVDGTVAPAKTEVDNTIAGIGRIYSPLRLPLVATAKRWIADPATAQRVDAPTLVNAARASLGGARPTAFDLVHILTTRELTYGGEPVIGYADCIGGVRYADRAFSVSTIPVRTSSVGPVNLFVDGTVETAAHEIGHLLGARHQHASCAEGAGADDAANRDPSACTLMINYPELQSPKFGLLESLVVRGYTERYATP